MGPETVGGALRRFRERLGFSAGEVGERLGVDERSVRRWEVGHRGLTVERLLDLLALYSLDLHDLANAVDVARGAIPAIVVRPGGGGVSASQADAIVRTVLPALRQEILAELPAHIRAELRSWAGADEEVVENPTEPSHDRDDSG